jgi:hypothetical protein
MEEMGNTMSVIQWKPDDKKVSKQAMMIIEPTRRAIGTAVISAAMTAGADGGHLVSCPETTSLAATDFILTLRPTERRTRS